MPSFRNPARRGDAGAVPLSLLVTGPTPPVPEAARAADLARLAVVLGLVSLSSSLGMNMYVPAFPMMAADLRVEDAAIQLSLTSFLVALAIGQNVYGPLSDRIGRRWPLFAGLGLFVIASIGSALAANLEALVGWRFVQGFGACAAMGRRRWPPRFPAAGTPPRSP